MSKISNFTISTTLAKQMKHVIDFISSLGVRPHDKEDAVLQKRFMIYQAVLMSMGGIIWGILSVSFHREWQSSVPFGYVVLSIGNLTFLHVTGNFKAAKTIQTAISLLLPFLFQWFLGGFIASGVVMLWALLSLAASVTYQSNRTVGLWLVMYVVLAFVSGLFDRTFVEWIRPDDAVQYSIVLIVLNVVAISAIVLWLVNFMVRGKNEALRKLAEAQSQLVQSEKMATLGTLAAGVAHELNNPAAATRRAAKQLQELHTTFEQARERLTEVDLSQEEKELMISLAQQAREIATRHNETNSLQRSDNESDVEDWLEKKQFANAWEYAPALVGVGLDTHRLSELSAHYRPEPLKAVLIWVAHVFPMHSLLHEINEGSSRISEIVVALKNYSFLGQAPVQQVDIHEGINNTLVILRSKLKMGIRVQCEYAADLPKIVAYGSELNQVWTNILDNAIDALKGEGQITIRTKRENSGIAVEIEDNGPGIPTEIQSRIFDPFFTTKQPGKGTGLGLSTSYGIVTEKHGGQLLVESRPGCTKFIIKLPINLASEKHISPN